MAKNTHLEHLEDDILNQGSQGGMNAIAFLRELGNFLYRQRSTINITTKWDGAPAVVCGTDPQSGKFFVGTKSVFAKTEPKICYTLEDITKFYGSEGQLAQKLRKCLIHLKKLNIRGVLQGDLLFTDDKVARIINSENLITFRPNTITYAVPTSSKLGREINAAELGIVFHTRYTGPSISEMSASFGVDIDELTKDSSVAVFSSTFRDVSGSANFSPDQYRNYVAAVNRAEGSLRQASKFLDVLRETGTSKFMMATLFKQYFNTFIKSGEGVRNTRDVARNFAGYYIKLLDKEILSKKTKAAQDKYLQMKKEGLGFIGNNENAIYMTVASYINLQTAKKMIINQLAKVNTLGTFLQTEDGFKVTAPEGFVAIKDGAALKLVDRLEFSRANFTIAKNWDKGDTRE
jgi:hypothetical protein